MHAVILLDICNKGKILYILSLIPQTILSMIFFRYNQTNYHKLVHDTASQLNQAFNTEKSLLTCTAPVGEGILKAVSLADELEVLLADIKFNDSITILRPSSNDIYYILHFDDVFIQDTAKFKIDDETISITNTNHSYARLTSSLFRNMEELPAGIHIRSAKVLFKQEWLKKYMQLDANDEVLIRYLSLKTESLDFEPLDATYKQILDEICEVELDDPLYLMHVQNRITLLIERFFTRLFEKTNLLQGKFNLANDVVERLIQMEKKLVEDFTTLPPTIDQLAKTYSMSTTLLKKNFKLLFGDSIYAYYQKLRIQKANELLATGTCNIKQVADAVGYNSVSSFTLAYKKVYNRQPGNFSTTA
jgi:AraC-like DNA-binding protein